MPYKKWSLILFYTALSFKKNSLVPVNQVFFLASLERFPSCLVKYVILKDRIPPLLFLYLFIGILNSLLVYISVLLMNWMILQVKMCGSVAYVSQSAWIQSGNIEENILFGTPMDKAKYKNVLHACSLKKDLELFSHGESQ